jgi:hypothetical protein
MPETTDAPIGGQHLGGTHTVTAASDGDQAAIPASRTLVSSAAWSSIGLYAAHVDDIERVRIAAAQRALALIREGAPKEHPDVLFSLALSMELEKTEAKAIKRLEWGMLNETPVGAWIKATPGLGLKSAGRFLGCVGDPRIRPLRGEPDAETGKRPIIGWAPRTVSALWAYCGLDVRDGKAPRRAKGTKGNWNAIARKRAYCMADPCIKNRKSPYRAVYDAARLKYAETEISDGHKHNRAMRAVMKEIVKDLWINARRGGSSRCTETVTLPMPHAGQIASR